MKCKSSINPTKVNILTILFFCKMYSLTKKWIFLKNYLELNMKYWLLWSILENFVMIISTNFWLESKKISLKFSIAMNFMKDFKMLNTSPEEDNKCCSGKFLSGKESQLLKKDQCTLFIKLNNFWKKKLNKMLSKRRNFHLVSKPMKLKSLLICTWTSTTMIKKTLLLRISPMFVVKKQFKSLNNKNCQVALWI